jgi:hypothetical protein
MKQEMYKVKQDLSGSDRKIKQIREETKHEIGEMNSRKESKEQEIE